ncbi:VOC family protein [Epilithonimonas sp. UC225_85]|uniref:VOC family protein n=1 Tax=Epilithonimonas sp. UC225_85 TaxID=3350167 RepID=UPI0036D31B45
MNHDIFPCFWFNQNGSEAAKFYTAIFKNSKTVDDTPMVINIEIEGQKLMFLNAGPQFRPNMCLSLMLMCDSPEEVEHYYQKLSESGKVMMELDGYPWSEKYAWVEDQYGISWQLYYNKEKAKQKFSPVMMFTGDTAGKCKEAIEFYTNIFPNSKTEGIMEHPEGQGEPAGNVAHAQFVINDYVMMAMDSSHNHNSNFTEGTSMTVMTKDQEETDYYWEKLTEGGQESMCGWLKDKYGFSWQIVPHRLIEITNSHDVEKAKKAFGAMMKMNKIIIKDIEDAANS